MKCTKDFICSGSLNEHDVIHSADKLFSCKKGNKDLFRLLKEHKIIHGEINPSPVSNVLEFVEGLMVLMPGD